MKTMTHTGRCAGLLRIIYFRRPFWAHMLYIHLLLPLRASLRDCACSRLNSFALNGRFSLRSVGTRLTTLRLLKRYFISVKSLMLYSGAKFLFDALKYRIYDGSKVEGDNLRDQQPADYRQPQRLTRLR